MNFLTDAPGISYARGAGRKGDFNIICGILGLYSVQFISDKDVSPSIVSWILEIV